MKFILILVVLFAVAAGAIYYSGWLSSPDPAELEKQVKTAAHNGSSWETIANIVPPAIYFDVVPENRTGRGVEQKFDRDVFAERVKKKSSADGYALLYNMSADIKFEVLIASDGKAEGTHDLPTIKSLTTPGGG